MKLSELYRQKMTELAMLVAAADASDDVDKRMAFNERAIQSQRESDCIAHCLAYFGDQPIACLVKSGALEHVRTLPRRLENPWVRGLTLLQHHFLA